VVILPAIGLGVDGLRVETTPATAVKGLLKSKVAMIIIRILDGCVVCRLTGQPEGVVPRVAGDSRHLIMQSSSVLLQ